jgi:hypothetical protein
VTRSLRSLHLLVPGLLGPLPALQRLGTLPDVSQLETCLARAAVADVAGRDLETTLCALFGIACGEWGGLPLAPLRLAGQGGQAEGGFWIQATPVCLRPDRDRLLLFDTRDIELPMADARELADGVCSHFSDLGWRLQLTTPHDWFLGMDTPPRIETCSLGDAFGRNIDQFLPKGEEALHWHGLLNEIQMLFHAAQTNQRREQRGEPTLSGVWFHGGGFLPRKVAAPFTRVWAGEALARGLAVQASITHTATLPDAEAVTAEAGEQLIVYDLLQRPVWRADPFDWCEGVAEFSAWLTGLVRAVGSGRLDELRLYPCNGRVYTLTAASLRRFWRRRLPLLSRLDEHRQRGISPTE